MRLYDCEQKAQDDIIENKQENDTDTEENNSFKKSFAKFKF